MSSEFLTLLGGIATDPDLPIGRLPLLDGESRREVLTLGNDTAAPYEDDICVHHAIERQSAERPDAVAVVVGERELTYGELDAQADRVARHLTDAGIGPETFVGICLGRSFEMIVAALAVMKAGAAYVPLDPSHPDERLATIAADAELSMVLTERRFLHRVPATVAPIVATDQLPLEPDAAPASTVAHHVDPDNAVYVLYTSGSTGKPKGIVVTHRNVLNFFAAMDDRIGCDATDTLLAVTTIGFDISVLELFWTLACGARVALVDDDLLGRQRTNRVIRDRDKPLDFSLFYFANADAGKTGDKYRLVLDGARFADENGFTAVWTPERHFHEFGGLYPNPSVLSAALATITRNVQLRAGSVVLPLHSPLRVAEEWALVDNLSGGRVGIAFASGWHANDFVFFPDNFDERKELMFEALQTVQALWRGGSLTARGGAGNEIEVKIFPTPVQAELPTWITAAGSPDTFARAGEIGANLLTHLLGQSIDQVAANIRRYRHARALAGHDPTGGCVTLMLHTFVGSDLAAVQEAVREPFKAYLRSSVGLIANLVTSLGLPFDLAAMSEADMDALLSFAFERYFSTSALFGTPDSVEPLIDTLKSHDIDEVACLIDFGIDADEVLANLSNLALVCERANAPSPRSSIPSLAEYIAAHRPTLLQATPSMMRMIALDTRNIDALHSLRALLLGGERLPSDLASALSDALPTRVLNMYGPTETTIWSSTHEVVDAGATIPIGKPIANTYFHIVNPDFEPVPIGAAGELVIGGLGVARGYWSRPDLTAERFVPDPFGSVAGGRVYRTGDLARYREDGSVEFLGRVDQQVKIRGFRVELGEIEAVLARDPSTREVAVTAREVTPGDVRVAAYVVGAAGAAPDVAALTDALRRELPEYMVPSTIVVIDSLPRTANGKIALRALPAPVHVEGDREHVAPSSKLEVQIADVWKRLLELETVGIYENFFDLGGHSLLMARVHAELAPILGSDVPLVSLFEHPTVSALARHLDGDGRREQSFDVSQERARQQRRRRSAHAVERAPGSSG